VLLQGLVYLGSGGLFILSVSALKGKTIRMRLCCKEVSGFRNYFDKKTCIKL